MKKIVIETEEKESLEGLLGERVTIFACRYIYTGELVGIDETSIKLSNCGIVYENVNSHQSKRYSNQKRII